MDDIERLSSQLAARGVPTAVELARDHGHQLAVLSNVDHKRLFCVAIRQEGTFVLGFKGFFQLRERADAVSMIAHLAAAAAAADFVLDREAFSLEDFSIQGWLEAGLRRRIRQQLEDGWQRLEDAESDRLWSIFRERFRFRLGTEPHEWPGIAEPEPFVTWSTSRAKEMWTSAPQEFARLEREARRHVLQAFLDARTGLDYLYVLDVNHVSYVLRLQVAARADVDRWPEPVIPIHNYVLYIDPSFTMGLFCHPWESSLCAFGVEFIDHVRRRLTSFDEVLRDSL